MDAKQQSPQTAAEGVAEMATTKELAARADATDAMLQAIAAKLGIAGDDDTATAEAEPVAKVKAQTVAKVKRVSVPSLSASDGKGGTVQAYPDSKYKGNILFARLDGEGVVRKTARIRTDALRAMLADPDFAKVIGFDWPSTDNASA